MSFMMKFSFFMELKSADQFQNVSTDSKTWFTFCFKHESKNLLKFSQFKLNLTRGCVDV